MLSTFLLPSLLLALAQGGSWRGRHGAGHLEKKYHSHGSHGGEHKHKHGSHGDRVLEQAAFTELSGQGGYETRNYTASVWVCTNMTVDTLADPLAGLEHMDIFQIRKSDRYRTKVPSSLTFKRLYRYISGANDGAVEIAITRGGYTRHSPILTSGPRAHQGDIEQEEEQREGDVHPPGPAPARRDARLQEQQQQHDGGDGGGDDGGGHTVEDEVGQTMLKKRANGGEHSEQKEMEDAGEDAGNAGEDAGEDAGDAGNAGNTGNAGEDAGEDGEEKQSEEMQEGDHATASDKAVIARQGWQGGRRHPTRVRTKVDKFNNS